MNLECLNTIISENLAIHIDIDDLRSWNLNTGLTLTSITKWNQSKADNLNLYDFGLTGYDNGRIDNMLDGITLNSNDNKVKLYRVGKNDASGNTSYSGYTISSFTGTSVGNYFNLNGGYFQGFFKLEGYNYELFPPRYNNGITIETIIELLPESKGIFFLMGTRAEDKYNPYFSGETAITGQTAYQEIHNITKYKYSFSGYTTSEGNYLEAFEEIGINKQAFSEPENLVAVIDEDIPELDNVRNNVIAFEITADGNIGYKYIDNDGLIAQNYSPNVITKIGWTIIDVVFTPYDIIPNYNPAMYNCYPRRTGSLMFYVNGRKFWKVNDFLEWYCTPLINNREKQLGVPFNISWGGGSFGLEHSWHFSGDTSNPLVMDTRKDNLLIQKYFNNSYIGNVQKLRMYDTAFTPQMVLHNALIEVNDNNYNIFVNKGGRLVNGVLSTANITQQTSGSDIRKSIKYRNADNTYRNLFDMLDIKVVVKSKSNTSVELIKFKKDSITGMTGWTGLIYIDNFTYDFIVPNTITAQHPNEVLYAEIKFQWADPYDIDGVLDRIFIINLTTSALLDNSIKNY